MGINGSSRGLPSNILRSKSGAIVNLGVDVDDDGAPVCITADSLEYDRKNAIRKKAEQEEAEQAQIGKETEAEAGENEQPQSDPVYAPLRDTPYIVPQRSRVRVKPEINVERKTRPHTATAAAPTERGGTREQSFSDKWFWQVLSPQGPPHALTRLVLSALRKHMQPDGGRCYPSQKLIADECALSLRTVHKHLRVAVAEGWIKRQRRQKDDGSWASYSYNATLPKREGGHARAA